MVDPSGVGAAVGAAKAAGAVIGKVVEEDQYDKKQLQTLGAKSSALRRAAEARARRVAVRQEIHLKIYAPLARMLGISRDYFENGLGEDLAAKTVGIPEADLVEPKAIVAGPTLQALAYSLDEPELKNLYLNLLSAASDGRRVESPHPSFVEVIKQLTPEEASLLKVVLPGNSLPIVRVRLSQEDGSGTTMHRHLLPWHITEREPVWQARFLDNCVRLGLLDIDYMSSLTDKSQYEGFESNPHFVRLKDDFERAKTDGRLPEDDSRSIDWSEGLLTVTDFGRDFFDRVVTDPPPGLEDEAFRAG